MVTLFLWNCIYLFFLFVFLFRLGVYERSLYDLGFCFLYLHWCVKCGFCEFYVGVILSWLVFYDFEHDQPFQYLCQSLIFDWGHLLLMVDLEKICLFMEFYWCWWTFKVVIICYHLNMNDSTYSLIYKVSTATFYKFNLFIDNLSFHIDFKFVVKFCICFGWS